MPIWSVPVTFPEGLTTGARNSQKTAASVIDECQRGLIHLAGARKTYVPLFCFPRVFEKNEFYYPFIRKQNWTREATLHIIYSTLTDTDYWTLEVGDYAGTKARSVDPTAFDSVEASSEVSIPIEVGLGAYNDHTSGSGNLSLSIQFVLAYRDNYYSSLPQQLTVYSAIIEMEPMTEISI
jgi:hypothetical protein